MTLRDQLADALRRRDVAQRGGNPEGLVPFVHANDPERLRWQAMADAALVFVGGRLGDVRSWAGTDTHLGDLVDACEAAAALGGGS